MYTLRVLALCQKEEVKFALQLPVMLFIVKKTLKYCKTNILRRLVFKKHVTFKWRKLSNNQIMGAL